MQDSDKLANSELTLESWAIFMMFSCTDERVVSIDVFFLILNAVFVVLVV